MEAPPQYQPPTGQRALCCKRLLHCASELRGLPAQKSPTCGFQVAVRRSKAPRGSSGMPRSVPSELFTESRPRGDHSMAEQPGSASQAARSS